MCGDYWPLGTVLVAEAENTARTQSNDEQFLPFLAAGQKQLTDRGTADIVGIMVGTQELDKPAKESFRVMAERVMDSIQELAEPVVCCPRIWLSISLF